MKSSILRMSVLSLLMAVPVLAQVSEIKQSLICMCECGMTVEACEGAMDCSSAAQITATIEKMVAEGKSKDTILAAFIEAYGEKVLAAPTKKGFNLTAWVLPFVAIFAAALVIYLTLGRWVRRRETRVKEEYASRLKKVDSRLQALLDEELQQYE